MDNLEFAEKKLERLETELAKTRTALESISSVPDKIKVTVRPGSITFKLEDCFVSFKGLADEIKSKFGGKLDKEFNENNGSYFLWAEHEGVLIKITGIPAPQGCDVQMQEVQVVQKKKRFLPFGQCESILK